MSIELDQLALERHDDPDQRPDCLGQWCCGCAEHPAGKPWGWNADAWAAHYQVFHPKALGNRGRLSPLAS